MMDTKVMMCIGKIFQITFLAQQTVLGLVIQSHTQVNILLKGLQLGI